MPLESHAVLHHLPLNKETITPLDSFKYLGKIFDIKLHLDEHVNKWLYDNLPKSIVPNVI